jgi:hypothetical protein
MARKILQFQDTCVGRSMSLLFLSKFQASLLVLLLCVSSGAAENALNSGVIRAAYTGSGCLPSSCGRGQLCLPDSNGVRVSRVCRKPKKFEVCDPVATCDTSVPSVKLSCIVMPGTFPGPTPYLFPSKRCVQERKWGQACGDYDVCEAGSSCEYPGYCASVSPAALGDDCERTNCSAVDRFFCQKNGEGISKCIKARVLGEACDPKSVSPPGDPCDQNLECKNGKCVPRPQIGQACSGGMFDECMQGGCVQSEGPGKKCLLAQLAPTDPCGDKINVGCILYVPDGARCIRGRCGLPSGGQGDVCNNSPCGPGHQCVQSPVPEEAAAVKRCGKFVDQGARCDRSAGFVACKSGFSCAQVRMSNSSRHCVSAVLAQKGRKCDFGTKCAEGLYCVQSGTGVEFVEGNSGVCVSMEPRGGSCSPPSFKVCDEKNILMKLTSNVYQRTVCEKGVCVATPIAQFLDKCGFGINTTCDTTFNRGELICDQDGRQCIRYKIPVGAPCELTTDGRTNQPCDTLLQCLLVNRTGILSPLCIKLVGDGERCDYGGTIGCSNLNSGCVRGICVPSSV